MRTTPRPPHAQDEDGDGRVKLRTFRCGAELYDAARITAKVRGESLSAVIRRALQGYVRRYAKDVEAWRREHEDKG